MKLPDEVASISTAEARAKLSDLFNRVAYGGERVVVRRRKAPLLALVPMEDLHFLLEVAPRSARSFKYPSAAGVKPALAAEPPALPYGSDEPTDADREDD